MEAVGVGLYACPNLLAVKAETFTGVGDEAIGEIDHLLIEKVSGRVHTP